MFVGNGIVNHNCQGSTLEYAKMNLGPSVFSPAMSYVSLSRVKSLDGIFLINFYPKSIFADKDALEFEKMIDKLVNGE